MSRSTSRGLTLIELVVAMSIFAMVAVMGMQSLTGTLRLRDRLADTAEQTAGLGAATSLLRNDLSAAISLLFYPAEAERPRPSLDASGEGQGFALSLGGQPVMPDTGSDGLTAPRQRVEWYVEAETSRLIRQVWPTLYPVETRQVSQAAVIMEGVQGLELRSYWVGVGWVAGVRPENMPLPGPRDVAFDSDEGVALSEALSDPLPLALEVALVTRDLGRITLMETLR
ncbi:type II secretion system protein GspJ [Roseovarius sp.]|uniref:type II secretion system protein GspJ n=1 Tax=Roseovarius sp. TaxID=1486281 RepID=UPI0026163999|nr:type II secretion system protein GspJ [Roseovarius sp.]MDM8167623.1 type II secretion system protein GspJ [Roseovarius sp.]